MNSRQFGAQSFHNHPESPATPTKPKQTTVDRWDGTKWVEVLLTWDAATERYIEVSR